MNESTINEADALTILEMAAVCYGEGIGPDYDDLLRRIRAAHPHLIEPFDYLPAFDA